MRYEGISNADMRVLTRSGTGVRWRPWGRVYLGTGNGICQGVQLHCQVQWQVATRFLCQCLRNQTTGPSTGVCKFCVNGRFWSRGSWRSRTPVRHQLPLEVEVAESGWGWYLEWLVRAVTHGRSGELHV